MLYSSLDVSCFEGKVQPLSQAINEQEAGGKHVELEMGQYLPLKHQRTTTLLGITCQKTLHSHHYESLKFDAAVELFEM
jgi:hypothetical protein